MAKKRYTKKRSSGGRKSYGGKRSAARKYSGGVRNKRSNSGRGGARQVVEVRIVQDPGYNPLRDRPTIGPDGFLTRPDASPKRRPEL